jgi:DNA-binding NarL/FixJ family response regulator
MALTKRQREVAILISRGMNDKEIALHLDVSYSTVKTHVRAILDRLPARNRVGAAVVVATQGVA